MQAFQATAGRPLASQEDALSSAGAGAVARRFQPPGLACLPLPIPPSPWPLGGTGAATAAAASVKQEGGQQRGIDLPLFKPPRELPPLPPPPLLRFPAFSPRFASGGGMSAAASSSSSSSEDGADTGACGLAKGKGKGAEREASGSKRAKLAAGEQGEGTATAAADEDWEQLIPALLDADDALLEQVLGSLPPRAD